MTDYTRTVMRQYANSTTLRALLDAFDAWVDPAKFRESFLRDVWDIDTARGFGLDIWGRILGQSRALRVQQVAGDNFGFDIGATPGTQWKPWGQAPWFNGSRAAATSYDLDDESYRQLLLVKAAANIASCDVPSLNALMRAMFGTRGRCYVGYSLDTPMFIAYNFEFFPTPVERAIIESGVFPVPAGMSPTYIFQTLNYAPWGFAGMNSGVNPEYVTGFNQGPFYNPNS